MHHVLNQPVDAANLSYHERRVFRLHTKDNTHFQLHRETVFRDHFEWVEGVGNFTRSPFHRLVSRGNDDRADGQRVDIVTSGPNHGFLNTTITFRNDVSFVCALVESPIGRVARHQISLDLFGGALIVHHVETSYRILDLRPFLTFHSLPNFRSHLTPDFF